MTATWVALLVASALRALVVALAVGAGLRLLGIRNVVAQKAAWTLVLLAALLLPLVPVVLPASITAHLPRLAAFVASPARQPGATPAEPTVRYEPAQNATASAVNQPAAQGHRRNRTAENDAPVLATPREARQAVTLLHATAPASTPARHRRIPALAVGLGVDLAIAVLLLTRQIYGLARAMRIWHAARPTHRIENLAVRFSHDIPSPVTVGSAVLLPFSALQWPEERRRAVLAHERSHVRQGDFYLQLCAGIYAALFWPSPLGWLLKRKLYELGEALGDRAGVEAASSPSSYAKLILEFAALPRPTIPGVAMASPSHLSQRIERLLDEARFHHAFARSRRALLALLIVPASLLTATALVRVEAATPQQSQATPATAQPTDPAAAAPAEQLPPPPPEDPQGPPPPPEGAPGMMPPPPQAGPHDGPGGPGGPQNFAQGPHRGPQDDFGPHDDPYTLVENGKTAAESHFDRPPAPADLVEKARKQTKSDNFLLFEHAGKHYIIDDPALIAQFKAAHKPMQDFSAQMRVQSEKINADIQKQMEQMRKQMNEIKVPDLTKELEQVSKAMADLKARQGTVIDRKQLADLQREISGVQQQLARLQFGGFAIHPGEQPHSPMPGFDKPMGPVGPQHEPDQATRAIIDESLKNGKAKPVE